MRASLIFLPDFDVSIKPGAEQTASWAGMCPGNHESAGKHHGGATRKGDPWLRGALGEAAAAASRSKDTYLQARYRRIASRRGTKRAVCQRSPNVPVGV
ncbi:transposase [Dactylosporangium sp. CA-152071]|uniref:transposase n=1 Tax=Dactylosporangium sp. CA-152071 TaxID=3239933 RepID=UPI003D92344D